MKQLKKTLLTLVALLAVTTGAWADEVKYPIVYDFEAAANAGENPANKNGSAANGQKFYGWENNDARKDEARQDYKGYEYAEGSKLPEVCHVWRRSDRINGNVAGNGGLKCPSNKEMAVDGLTEGLAVTIIYDATNAKDDSKEIVWAIGDGSSESLGEPRAKAIINGAEAVPGTTTIKSGDVITVTKVTPAANGSGYIVFGVKKDMVIKKIIIDVAPAAGTPVALTRGTGDKINEWTLTNKMPAGNVTVTAEYFPQATAAEGALTAATGVAATTSAPLVTLDASKLTGATKLMYLASTDATKPAYDAQGWSDKVPTADSFTEAGNVNVWYYPVGTDDEDPAKTFSDGDICATALTVTLAAAPTYDISFNAANANTIEAGKATVTVGGTAATLTEGKVTGVKMGQQVKMTAAQGYKFRKVEAKKTTDFTDCVSTTAWTGMDAMSPAFSTPEVTTSDGRKTRFAEVYRTDVSATGVIMQQTVNVANGTYIVELYANSCAAQDVTTDMADGATDVAYVFANDVKKFITSKIASAFSESGVYTLEVTVTDGQLTLGIGKEKAGTNWHTIQIKSLNQKASSGNE